MENLGIVVIGRNEGDRLHRCFNSISNKLKKIVYVDSGSTDRSVELAKSLKIDSVELDMSKPFTMARARNVGFKSLIKKWPEIEIVQFIDGDCEMIDGYLEEAYVTMNIKHDAAIITGRRIERFPHASIYNQLCNIEWGRDVGEITSCGGDMMVRADIFKNIGMFNSNMIAGEEPELCVRLREAGKKIFRINKDMTLHDAAIYKFSQWFKRAIRGGHAFAEGAALHGKSATRHNVRDVRSILLWGIFAPLIAIGFAVASLWWGWALVGSLAVLFGYIFLAVKITYFMKKKGYNFSNSCLYALACVIAKLPGLIGVVQFWINRLRGKRSRLIEYKEDLAGTQRK